LLEEVAKFRAARRMWAKIMRERFGAKDPRSWMLRFHTQTAGVTLQAQQIDNNVARVTVQALAAVLGGTQSLHTNAKTKRWPCQPRKLAQLGAANAAGTGVRKRRGLTWSTRWRARTSSSR